MKIGFAVIVDSATLKKIVGLENKIHEEAGFQNFLGLDQNLPHTTLFQGNLSESLNYRKVADELAGYIEENFSGAEVKFEKIIYKPTGWYFLLIRKEKWLERLHYKTLELCEPYIIHEQGKNQDRTEKLEKSEAEAIEKYNYRYAGKAYLPHITIGRGCGESEETLEKLNRLFSCLANQKAPVSRITVYKMGPNGTHEETLYEVDLSQANQRG